MTKIKGIAEIVLNVRDVAASLKFYQEVLGLEMIGRPGPVFLRAGNPAISVPQMVVLVPLPPIAILIRSHARSITWPWN